MAADGASIGDVYVTILPDGSGFWTKAQAQLGPQADKVGADLGRSIGDRIAKGIREGISAGFTGNPGREQGKRTGDDFAGEFDRTVRTRIAAALRALPKAEIGAATTEAEQKIRDLRASLLELSGKRIGVDISDDEAIAKLDTLRADMEELARTSTSHRVNLDLTRASAELAAFKAQLAAASAGNVNLPGPSVAPSSGSSGVASIGAAAQSSAGGMSALLAAGIALGPGIIPVAAAVTAAIAGIGVGALGVGAGLGVVLLGTHGIADAVTAMGAADQNAAKDSATLAGRQSQVASASDAVRSAQGGLAQAVANAADTQRRAAQTVATAEQSLADAQRQARQAQLDLTAARKAEVQAEEDLANSVVDGANAQRQAALDQAAAQQQLNAVLANPASTAAQREQAQLTFDEAVQHAKELALQQGRLVEQQKQAAKVGVDGSTQVLAAQDRVRAANQGVGKAEQALSDARIEQAKAARDAAFSVAQATQGVVSAQRSLAQATATAGASGSASMEALRQKLAALTPEGQRFAAFIYSLKPVFGSLTNAAQAGMLPGLQDGITAVLPLLPVAIRGVSLLSTTVGQLASEAGHALASQYWANFFTFLANEANTSLIAFAHIAGNAAVGASGLVRAFAPLGQEVGVGLIHFTEQFAHWATTLGTNSTFIAFLGYVHTEGPVVVATIGNLATTTEHLVQAAAPIGSVVLVVLRDLSGVINAIPIPILTGLAGTIVTVVAAMKTWQLVQSALNFAGDAWTFILKGVNATTAFTGDIMRGATTGTLSFGTALRSAKTAADETKGGLGSLGGFLAGPWGVALTAGTVLIGLFAAAHANAAAKEQAHESRVRELTDAIKQSNGVIDENVRKVAAKNAYDEGALQLADKLGISLSDVTNAYIQGGGAVDNINAKLDSYIQAQTEAMQHDQEHSTVYTTNIKNARDLIAILNGQKNALGASADATKLQTEAAKQSGTAAVQQTAAQEALGAALVKVADSTASAADKADALQKAQAAIFGPAQAADQAEEALAASQDKLGDAVKRSSDAHLTGAHSLDIHTQAGRDNRDALIGQLKASDEEYFAAIRNGAAVDEATKKHDQETEALRTQAHQLGLNSVDVEHLINIYGLVPTDVKTQITVSGVQQALTQLQNLEIAQLALMQGIPVDQATKEYLNQHKAAQSLAGGLATGGPVFGPGGPTDDMVPARLSAGEHVWTAAEVNAAGGHRAVESIRQAVLGTGWHPDTRYPGDGSGGLAFARGGPVIWPFPVTAAHTKIPTFAEMQQVALFGPAIAGSIGAGLQAAAAFVKSQVGKPYLWASAGPNGYDCSGIGSAALNVARGRSPYSHTFSTSTEAGFFPQSGFGPFTAAWTNPGERGPGGNSVGHTAFRIGNYAFESTGSGGVHDGASVTPLSAFAHIGHATFDQGGELTPGLTMAYNGTGRSEWVFTDDQVSRLTADRAGAGRDAPVINVYGGQGQPVNELAAAVSHELAWALRG